MRMSIKIFGIASLFALMAISCDKEQEENNGENSSSDTTITEQLVVVDSVNYGDIKDNKLKDFIDPLAGDQDEKLRVITRPEGLWIRTYVAYNLPKIINEHGNNMEEINKELDITMEEAVARAQMQADEFGFDYEQLEKNFLEQYGE
ncbi:MAG: hypothetical protein Kapaf2KO_16670 [Candidatus Kapaibacteriales bacterium]